MRSRYALAAVMLPLLAAVPASASILSATGQSTRSPNADYLRVTTVQSELNTTMREMNDASAATGGINASAPANEGGAYVLQKEGTGGRPGINPKLEDMFTPGDGHEEGRVSINARDVSVHSRPGRYDGNKGGGNRDRHGDPHAAPEPSTWMLLGTGLAMMGGYVVIRRRAALEG